MKIPARYKLGVQTIVSSPTPGSTAAGAPKTSPEPIQPAAAELQGTDARALTGLQQWAGTLGTDPDNALAMAGCILGGLAVPFASLSFPWGLVNLPKLDLIVLSGHGTLQHALSFLLSAPRRINRAILEKMAGINPALLRHLAHASFAGDPSRADPHGNVESVALRDLRQGLAFDPNTNHIAKPDADLLPDLRQRRVESITRPALLLESPAPGDLLKLLAACHQSHGLGVEIRLASLLGSGGTPRQIKQLVRLLNGSEVMLPSPKYPVAIEHNRPAGLQAIFTGGPDVIRPLLPGVAPLLEHCLVLANTTEKCRVSEASGYFISLFDRVATRVAIGRREGIPQTASFKDDRSAEIFQNENITFLGECDGAGVAVGTSIRGMPMTFLWTFLVLRAHMRNYGPPDDGEVITAVFVAARNLLHRHCQQVVDLTDSARREQMARRARAIVRKIEEKRMLSFSALVRSFDQQRVSLYRPLVDLLVEADVIERRPDGMLSPGARPFQQVLPGLLFPPAKDEEP